MAQHKWANEIKAFADGKTVQYRRTENHIWKEVHLLNLFDVLSGEFRIKPEKKVVWINIYSNGGASCPHPNKESADYSAELFATRIACVKVEYYEGEGLGN